MHRALLTASGTLSLLFCFLFKVKEKKNWLNPELIASDSQVNPDISGLIPTICQRLVFLDSLWRLYVCVHECVCRHAGLGFITSLAMWEAGEWRRKEKKTPQSDEAVVSFSPANVTSVSNVRISPKWR